MSYILSLESSTSVCSVAIRHEGKLLSSLEIHIEQVHAAKLAVLIEQISQTCDVPLSKLNAVAVTSGPGSYTGLRIGTSTAKGICYALNLPLIAVSTLEVMAQQVMSYSTEPHMLFCPMIDARRMEVYTLLRSSHTVIKPIEALVIDHESYRGHLAEHKIVFFGNGAAKCKSVIDHPNALFIEGVHPSAATLGAMAHQKLQQGLIEDLIHFEPLYLKEFLIKKSTKNELLLNKE